MSVLTTLIFAILGSIYSSLPIDVNPDPSPAVFSRPSWRCRRQFTHNVFQREYEK